MALSAGDLSATTYFRIPPREVAELVAQVEIRGVQRRGWSMRPSGVIARPMMRQASSPATAGQTDIRLGLLLGLAGVLVFSLTLPVTRRAVQELAPEVVGLGRTIPAALLALVVVAAYRRLPRGRDLPAVMVCASGVVFGFPLLSALAMRTVDASHGAVVLAVLPLLTAAAGAVLAGERPSARFWLWAVLGSASVLGFALLRSRGGLAAGDLYLLAASLLAAIGYAVGGRLAREAPGLLVIAWALVVSLPVLLVIGVALWPAVNTGASATAWACFAYVAVMSQFLGFYFWYRGLALGGIARVGQVQLFQTFFTLAASALLLGERLDALTLGFALLTFLFVWLARRERIAAAAPR
ncbi:DMT family transporter [Benzoatithermus flavus]|uniref:DMT family transporter n=1 Tax=Benzoatithermus flavus TaxID=3108223 RepID=A0ABU8XN71_9PROT